MIENRAVNRVYATGLPVGKENTARKMRATMRIGTWRNFCGENTSDVCYPRISEVDEASSSGPCRSGIDELHYPRVPLDRLTSHHRVGLGGSSPWSSSSSISMTSTGVARSILATSPDLLDPPLGKVALDDRVDP